MDIKKRPVNADYMLMNKPSYPRISSWPNLVWIIFLMTIFLTIVLWAASFLFNAPLEEMAAWAKTPNPAKAPWYFIGLQELLVYFDPWIAGVMIPQQILIGLALIPFIDISPTEQGKYSYQNRKFAVAFFTFGMFFWFALIVVGQLLRGPSWNIYWPFIDYDLGSDTWVREGVHLKEVATGLWSLPLGTGLALLIGFATVGMIAPVLIPRLLPKLRISKMLQEYLNALGPIRYIIVQSHVLMFVGVLGKIFMRLVLNIRYVIETPWFKI
jgi:hypothetical protein